MSGFLGGVAGAAGSEIGRAVGQAAAPHAGALIPAFSADNKRSLATRAAVRLNMDLKPPGWGWLAFAGVLGFCGVWGVMSAGAAALRVASKRPKKAA